MRRRVLVRDWARHCFVGIWFGATAWCAHAAMPPVQTVFVVVMENADWAEFKNSTNAPYLNQVLLPQAAFCERYVALPGVHPSLPNYIWMEAGTNFGIADDFDPDFNHQNTTNHLVTQLMAAGISWKTYQEDISGSEVPLTGYYLYAPRHNPFVFFDDVTGTNDPGNAYGLAHIRPYSELAADLTNHTVARYNFLTPNVCHDGHDLCAPYTNHVRQSDAWLAAELPRILGSAAFQDRGAVFITWDESFRDKPVGMVVLSPLIRAPGFSSTVTYTHSSFLRTMQEIFGVGPWLGGAANAEALTDLFQAFRLTGLERQPDGSVKLTATVPEPGHTNVVQASSDMIGWTGFATNSTATNQFTVTDPAATNCLVRYYRLLQLP